MLQLLLLSALAAHSGLIGSTLAAQDLGNVIFSSVLFRHGDRAPTSSYPNDPYNDVAKYWPRGYGQLSEIGEEQHYQLGSFLRQRYSDLLPLTYNTNDTYIRSTDVDRTLVSARCNLAGLYPATERTQSQPNIKFQAIPIHTETSSNDDLLVPFYNCAKYTTLLSNLKNSSEYLCIVNETAQVLAEVAAFAGTSESSAITLADILFIQELYNLTLPDWVKPYYPNPLKSIELVEGFISAAGTTELQRLSAGPLLKKIIENMQSKLNGSLSPDRKLYLYSAHDTNLVNLLQALKVFNGVLVPYASAVVIELRERYGGHYVTVSYKNSTTTEPYLLKIPGCGSMCPLTSFIELNKEVIPDDEADECAESVVAGTKYDFQVPAAAILPEWEHCFKNSKTSVNGVNHHVISFQI